MQIHIQLTEAIINHSLKLHYAHTTFKERYKILYVPVALAVLAIYLIVQEYRAHLFTSSTWLGFLYIGMAIVLYMYTSYKREHAGKQLLKSFGENSAFEMEVTDDDVITKLSDSTIDFKWTAFTKGLVSKDIVLLYQQNQSFSMFEEQFFDNEDFTRFKKMVIQHVMDVKQV